MRQSSPRDDVCMCMVANVYKYIYGAYTMFTCANDHVGIGVVEGYMEVCTNVSADAAHECRAPMERRRHGVREWENG